MDAFEKLKNFELSMFINPYFNIDRFIKFYFEDKMMEMRDEYMSKAPKIGFNTQDYETKRDEFKRQLESQKNAIIAFYNERRENALFQERILKRLKALGITFYSRGETESAQLLQFYKAVSTDIDNADIDYRQALIDSRFIIQDKRLGYDTFVAFWASKDANIPDLVNRTIHSAVYYKKGYDNFLRALAALDERPSKEHKLVLLKVKKDDVKTNDRNIYALVEAGLSLDIVNNISSIDIEELCREVLSKRLLNTPIYPDDEGFEENFDNECEKLEERVLEAIHHLNGKYVKHEGLKYYSFPDTYDFVVYHDISIV